MPLEEPISDSQPRELINRWTVIKNVFANVARGSAAALTAVLLPPFLTRIITKDAYGTWLLVLQLSVYVSYLDFGIQTAVGRFVAQANELKEYKNRDGIVSTSMAILIGSGLVAMLGITIISWQIGNIFQDMPRQFHQEAQLAFLFVAGSLAFSLPFSVFIGIFIGLQRYDIPAWIIGLSKLFGGILTVFLAYSTRSIAWMGFGMAASTIGASVGQFIAYRKIAKEIHLSRRLISGEKAKEIINYCSGLLVWYFATLLISGLDTTIVGYFDYKSIAYWTLSASLTNLIIQLQTAVFGVIMPTASSMDARGNSIELGKLLISSTRYCVLLLLATGLPLIIWSKWILRLWVGEEYAEYSANILQVLAFANIIRIVGVPYANIVLATGQQNLIIKSPLIAGALNLILSLIGCKYFGAAGVAWATVIAGVFEMAYHIIYNLSRTNKIGARRQEYLLMGILRPLMCFFPSIILLVISRTYLDRWSSSIYFYLPLSIIISIAMIWKFAFSKDEKTKFVHYVQSKLQTKT